MSPIQQMLLGVGGAGATKTYVDDLFSTFLYDGDGASSKAINNTLDLSGEGGLTWLKGRSDNDSHYLIDTVRGANKTLDTSTDAFQATPTDVLTAFNSNGFTLGGSGNTNNIGNTYVSWSLRRAKGFFDVVTWAGGDETYKNISHNLGSVPGMIIVKRITGGSGDWFVYHRSLNGGINSWQYRLSLNNTWSESSAGQSFLYSAPTATQFQIGDWFTNNGSNYVAYVFAGGEEGYNSVNFNKASSLQLASNADLSPGTGDFTFECWLYPTQAFGSSWETIYHNGVLNGLYIGKDDADDFVVRASNNTNFIAQSTLPSVNQWTHIAVTRSGSTLRLFYDGVLKNTVSNSHNFQTASTGIGQTGVNPGEGIAAKISNLRFVKGTAVYTSAFTPPTAPLTNITNTKLLCCNGDLTTSSTVTPETITNNPNGIPNTGGTSPFTSPDAVFGENEDQNVIKCGTYVGNGSSTAGVEVNLGWEPQFIMLKESDNAGNNWSMWDPMRGITTGGADALIEPNSNGEEWGGSNYLTVTPTGFKLESDTNNISGREMIYIAIRRPDGSCGKLPELGTDVFNIDLDGTNSGDPSWVSGFPVDMQFIKDRAGTTFTWFLSTRLTQGKYLSTASSGTQNANSVYSHDYQNGWGNYSSANGITSWMWKRHAGFDCIAYKSDGVAGRQLPHSLGRAPEMLWIKDREHTRSWAVYHKGLNSGTNPEDYWLKLDDVSEAEDSNTNIWHSTAPTATHISLGASHPVNTNLIHDMICLAFASVDGISKVGNYTTNSTGAVSVTLGFQPRLVIIKRADLADTGWVIFDSARGLNTSGNNPIMQLNANYAQGSSAEQILRTDTGFTVSASVTNANIKGTTSYPNGNFIYYAHA